MVIDTMVFAYALLGVPEHREEAFAVLKRARMILAPDSLRAELANVVWQWVRTRGVPLDVGIEVLRDAEALVARFVSSEYLWERALKLAAETNHPAYDTLFIALAERERDVVVSYDKKLKSRFPNHVALPAEVLS